MNSSTEILKGLLADYSGITEEEEKNSSERIPTLKIATLTSGIVDSDNDRYNPTAKAGYFYLTNRTEICFSKDTFHFIPLLANRVLNAYPAEANGNKITDAKMALTLKNTPALNSHIYYIDGNYKDKPIKHKMLDIPNQEGEYTRHVLKSAIQLLVLIPSQKMSNGEMSPEGLVAKYIFDGIRYMAYDKECAKIWDSGTPLVLTSANGETMTLEKAKTLHTISLSSVQKDLGEGKKTYVPVFSSKEVITTIEEAAERMALTNNLIKTLKEQEEELLQKSQAKFFATLKNNPKIGGGLSQAQHLQLESEEGGF